MLKYSDITTKIDDELRDITTAALDTGKKFRAIRSALDAINIGDIGKEQVPGQIGYNFQKQVDTFIHTNLISEYTFATVGVTEAAYKFFWQLRPNSDEDEIFEYVKDSYLRDQAGRRGSSRNMVADDFWDNGTRKFKINHGQTQLFDLEWVSTYLVIDDDLTTLKDYPDSENDVDCTFLIPDRFHMVLVYLAAADLLKMVKDFDRSKEHLWFLQQGQMKLERLIASHGLRERHPVTRPKIRQEMGLRAGRVSRR